MKATLKQETMGLPAGAEVEILEPGPKVSVIRGPMNTRVSVANGLLEEIPSPSKAWLGEGPAPDTAIPSSGTPVEEIPDGVLRTDSQADPVPYPENPFGTRSDDEEE